jgi:hypothetical protein
MTTSTFQESFKQPITSRAAACRFIELLVASNLAYHFEDSANSIGNTVNGEWVRTFSDEEAEIMDERVNELYYSGFNWDRFGGCPIGYQLRVLKRVGAI